MGQTLDSGLVSGYIDDYEVPSILDSFKSPHALEPVAKPAAVAAVAAVNPKLQMRLLKDDEVERKGVVQWGMNEQLIVGSVDQTINSHRISYLINHGSSSQSHHKDVYGSSDSSNDSD